MASKTFRSAPTFAPEVNLKSSSKKGSAAQSSNGNKSPSASTRMPAGYNAAETQEVLHLGSATVDELLTSVKSVLVRIRKEESDKAKADLALWRSQEHSRSVQRLLNQDKMSGSSSSMPAPALHNRQTCPSTWDLATEVFPTYEMIHSPLTKNTKLSPGASCRRLFGEDILDTGSDPDEQKKVEHSPTKEEPKGIIHFEKKVIDLCRELTGTAYPEPNASGGFYSRRSCSHCGRLLLSQRTKFEPQERCSVCADAKIRFGCTSPEKYHSQTRLDRLVDHRLQMDIGKINIYDKSVADKASAIEELMRTQQVNDAKNDLMHLCTMRVNRYHVPAVDMHSSLQKVIVAVVDRMWDYFGGGDRLQMQERLRKMQETMERQTQQYLKEVDWYRSQGLANEPWFEGARSGECLSFFKNSSGAETPEAPFAWFYNPLSVFSDDKQDCMKYLIDQSVYRILTRPSGAPEIEKEDSIPKGIDCATQTNFKNEEEHLKTVLSEGVEKLSEMQKKLDATVDVKVELETKLQDATDELREKEKKIKVLQAANAGAMELSMRLEEAERQVKEAHAENRMTQVLLSAEKEKMEGLTQSMEEMEKECETLQSKARASFKTAISEEELEDLQNKWKAEQEMEEEKRRHSVKQELAAKEQASLRITEALMDKIGVLEDEIESFSGLQEKLDDDARKSVALTQHVVALQDLCEQRKSRIEELQRALNEGTSVDHLAVLRDFLIEYTSRPVFERLYKDASERIERCERRRAEGQVEAMEKFLELLKSQLLNTGGTVSRRPQQHADAVEDCGNNISESSAKGTTKSYYPNKIPTSSPEDDGEFLLGGFDLQVVKQSNTTRTNGTRKGMQKRTRKGIQDTEHVAVRRANAADGFEEVVKLKQEQVKIPPAPSKEELKSRAFKKVSKTSKGNLPVVLSNNAVQEIQGANAEPDSPKQVSYARVFWSEKPKGGLPMVWSSVKPRPQSSQGFTTRAIRKLDDGFQKLQEEGRLNVSLCTQLTNNSLNQSITAEGPINPSLISSAIQLEDIAEGATQDQGSMNALIDVSMNVSIVSQIEAEGRIPPNNSATPVKQVSVNVVQPKSSSVTSRPHSSSGANKMMNTSCSSNASSCSKGFGNPRTSLIAPKDENFNANSFAHYNFLLPGPTTDVPKKVMLPMVAMRQAGLLHTAIDNAATDQALGTAAKRSPNLTAVSTLTQRPSTSGGDHRELVSTYTAQLNHLCPSSAKKGTTMFENLVLNKWQTSAIQRPHSRG